MMENQALIDETKKITQEYHYLTTVCQPPVQTTTKGRLAGYAITVKDAILVKDIETTATSSILSGYAPLFNATVVSRILAEGGTIIGKTSHDEFGFGSFNVNIPENKKAPVHPLDIERACGGSSGGSAGFTAKASFKHISLGESTGGSIACPAAFCGVVGLCPTYGRVSRYGLIDYGNSLDKIGPLAKTVKDAALMLEIIAGPDEHDSTAAREPVDEYSSYVNKSVKGMKVGVIQEHFGKGVQQEVAAAVKKSVEQLKKQGVIVEEVSLPVTSAYGLAVYYVLATPEASTNLAKLCGMRYGIAEDPTGKSFNEYFSTIRSSAFSAESKRRILIGTFARMAGSRDAFYIKAAKVRTLIIEEYKKLFRKYDALISPTMPIIAPKFTEIAAMSPLEQYMMDALVVGPNVAGMPHLSVPCGTVAGMPVGTLLISNHFEEKKLIMLGSALEESHD